MNGSPRTTTRNTLVAALASLVLTVSAGLTLAAATAAPASAATPCWKALINDWFDGKIDHVYPKHCYTQAIAHLPTDVKTYSNAPDQIRAAMLAAYAKKPNGGGGGGGGNSSSGSSGTAVRNPQSASASPPAQKSDSANKGLILRAIEWLGPSDAAAVPLPLLVLAGVAFLLLAAAGGSLLNRRLQARRLQPPPQV